jgi:hypothetical protein
MVSFSALVVVGALAASTAAATPVSSGNLKIDGLSKLTKGGKLSLVGFAWEGPAKLFANGVNAEALAATAGDTNFSVAADGPATLCEGLKQLSTEAPSEGRLSFKGTDGPLKAMTLDGVTVSNVDCSKTPWTAQFQAASLADAEEHTRDKAKVKEKKQAKKKDKDEG